MVWRIHAATSAAGVGGRRRRAARSGRAGRRCRRPAPRARRHRAARRGRRPTGPPPGCPGMAAKVRQIRPASWPGRRSPAHDIGVRRASARWKQMGGRRSRACSPAKARSKPGRSAAGQEVPHRAANPGFGRGAEPALQRAGGEQDAAVGRDFQQDLGRRQGEGEKSLPVRHPPMRLPSIHLQACQCPGGQWRLKVKDGWMCEDRRRALSARRHKLSRGGSARIAVGRAAPAGANPSVEDRRGSPQGGNALRRSSRSSDQAARAASPSSVAAVACTTAAMRTAACTAPCEMPCCSDHLLVALHAHAAAVDGRDGERPQLEIDLVHARLGHDVHAQPRRQSGVLVVAIRCVKR